MTPTLRATPLTLVIVSALAAAASSGCEDQAIGRPCDLQADAGTMQPTLNGQALECPSRVCMLPAKEVAATVTTVPYCTAECSDNDDCDGETRSTKNPLDKRCEKGFTCGVATVTGSFRCKKVCICKDFVNPQTGVVKPSSCP